MWRCARDFGATIADLAVAVFRRRPFKIVTQIFENAKKRAKSGVAESDCFVVCVAIHCAAVARLCDDDALWAFMYFFLNENDRIAYAERTPISDRTMSDVRSVFIAW
jgi:hypothetical protein